MALNPNHAFEDLEDIKCAIVEKNCTPQRVDFLKRLLEHNGFKVVVVKSPPPKTAAKPAAPNPENPDAVVEAPPPPPETFTVGVTDVTFSPTNAVFNRELKTERGQVVTSAYWKQQESAPKADEWYWKK
ncbi:MAG: hypothetical protein WCG87_01415 [Bacteroidota bacterium]